MLTKDEILRKMAGFDCPSYLHESCWQPIYDQCVEAIDLAAENEELKEDQRRGNQKIKEVSMAYGKLQAENARLKADLSALTDVRRVADNLLEMERINRMGDLAAENKLLRAKLDAVRGRCKRTPMSAVAIEVLEILDKDGDGE